jgi:uncharacterized protein (DUF2252 family)
MEKQDNMPAPKQTRPVSIMRLRSPEERLQAGRAWREKVPRKSHAGWKPPDNRPDPIQVLRDSDKGRIPELLPIRYGRMSVDPFRFLRGAVAIMACDLAPTPATGIRVQACGDCHIMNFGAFATPERNLIFDVNDFDETLPAPWEWDIKRLTASIEVATRTANFKSQDRERAVRAAVSAYREQMAQYAMMPPLEVWYQRIDLESLVKNIPQNVDRERTQKEIQKARKKTMPIHVSPSLTRHSEQTRIRDEPPLIYHLPAQLKAAYRKRTLAGLQHYRESLAPPYRVLFDRYRFQDIALKVVGIGSVGTYCEAAFFTAGEGSSLILQVKEARDSVLERYAGASAYATHGERVVVGQLLMQSASDIFLGWTAGMDPGRHFYIRQLRDMKIAMPVDTHDPSDLVYFAKACGWAVALAHARSGDPAMIAGYLGSSDAFDDAIIRFAANYADQTEGDYEALLKGVKAGQISARIE